MQQWQRQEWLVVAADYLHRGALVVGRCGWCSMSCGRAHCVGVSPVVLLTSYASSVCCLPGSVGGVALVVAVDLECSCAVTWAALARVGCQREVRVSLCELDGGCVRVLPSGFVAVGVTHLLGFALVSLLHAMVVAWRRLASAFARYRRIV